MTGMATKKEMPKDLWELRKGRKVWVSSPAPYLGYNESARESLRKKGFRFYRNGKAVD